jgi:predicted phosphodiesterase
MRLLILSDLHIEFGTFEVPKDIEYDVAILAGDTGVPGDKAIRWAKRVSTFGRAKATIVVAGTREFYGTVMQRQQNEMRAAADNSRVHYFDCREGELDGVRFLGCTLWTDFALGIETPQGRRSDPAFAMRACREGLTDYQVIRTQVGEDLHSAIVRRLRPRDTLAIHKEHRTWLLAALKEPFDGPTVVITHHAPHRQSLAQEFEDDWASTAYVSELPDEFFEVPKLWVHGHTHRSFDYQIGNCRVMCNPRGYLSPGQGPENERFDPRLAVDL